MDARSLTGIAALGDLPQSNERVPVRNGAPRSRPTSAPSLPQQEPWEGKMVPGQVIFGGRRHLRERQNQRGDRRRTPCNESQTSHPEDASQRAKSDRRSPPAPSFISDVACWPIPMKASVVHMSPVWGSPEMAGLRPDRRKLSRGEHCGPMDRPGFRPIELRHVGRVHERRDLRGCGSDSNRQEPS